MTDSKKLTLDVTDKSYDQIQSMAKNLNTNPAGVISQALALFMMIQGKKVVIKDLKESKELVIDTYSKKPAPSEG